MREIKRVFVVEPRKRKARRNSTYPPSRWVRKLIRFANRVAMWSISFVIPGVYHCQVGNRVPIDKHGLPCGWLRFPPLPFSPAWGARVNFPGALWENVRRRGTRLFRDKNRAVAIRRAFDFSIEGIFDQLYFKRLTCTRLPRQQRWLMSAAKLLNLATTSMASCVFRFDISTRSLKLFVISRRAKKTLNLRILDLSQFKAFFEARLFHRSYHRY